MSEDRKPYRYEPIALSSESTVVAEFGGAAAAARGRYRHDAEVMR